MTSELVYCPDCDSWFTPHLFVSHREQEHPPRTITVEAAGAIASATRFGTDPPLEED